MRALATAVGILLLAGCSQTVTGEAHRTVPGLDDGSRSPVGVEAVILDQSRMRALTGAGEDLTIVPTMDGKLPVDIDALAATVPDVCAWLFADTQTFGTEVEEFHKTTFQNPPAGGLISEAVAAYRDEPTARRAFADLVGRIDGCAETPAGPRLVGDTDITAETARTRTPGGCGRDYRVKSVVLAEVTACRFSPAIPELVLTNLLDNVPG